MSPVTSRRNIFVISTAFALLLVFAGLITTGKAVAAKSGIVLCRSSAMSSSCDVVATPTPTEAPVPVPPTPESGVRGCAVSKLVGYRMGDGSYQFYYVGSNGQGSQIGGFTSETMAAFLASPAGTKLTLTGPDGSVLSLTKRSDGAFDTSYKDSNSTCH